MTLPASGPVSLSDVNVEMNRSATESRSLSDIYCTTLSGTYEMNSLHGKARAHATLYNAGGTVPLGTTSITVSACGGGGGSGGHHDGGYGTYCLPGGPGGSVQNYVLSVTAGDTFSVTIGGGGGPGNYNKSGWTFGGGGAPTHFYHNNTLKFTCGAGGTGGGIGGTSHINGAGVISYGTTNPNGGNSPGQLSGLGYGAWNYNYIAIGSPTIVAPAAFGNNQLGLAERAGWSMVSY